MPLLTTVLFYGLTRRQKLKSARQERKDDPRPSVVYIRPFATESDVFAMLPRKGVWRYIPLPDTLGIEAVDPDTPRKSFGAFFQAAVREAAGPFVALGSLWDALPPNDGVARDYKSDESWQTYFASVADKAAFVLASPEISGNFLWELKCLRRTGLSKKLFLCTSPDLGATIEELRCLGFLFGRKAPPMTWDHIREQFEKLGYKPPNDNPGPGAVLATDSDGYMRVILQGATKPEQYVAAI
jgi:hypothetical protein